MDASENRITSGLGRFPLEPMQRRLTMADKEEKGEKTTEDPGHKPETTEEDWIDTSNDQLKACVDKDSHNRKESIDDLRFSWGFDRWDKADEARRKADYRPIMDFDLINKNISRAVGDARQNRVTGKIRAADNKADANIAKIRGGYIAGVQHESDAERIYDYAYEMMYRGAYGAWQIKTRWSEDNPFQQEIYMQRIKNPNQVYMDAEAIDECKADANHGFLLSKMSLKAFKRKFPNAKHTPDNQSLRVGSGLAAEMYWDKDSVTVADKYEIHTEDEEWGLLSDGRVLPIEEAEKAIKDFEDKRKVELLGALVGKLPASAGQAPPSGPLGQPQMGAPSPPPAPQGPANPVTAGGAAPTGQPPQPGPPQAMPGQPPPPVPQPAPPSEDEEKLHIKERKKTKRRRVRHFIMTAFEILSKNGVKGEPFPGKYVPLIVGSGPEINIEGKSYNRSGIKFAKDPQRNYSYWNTGAAEQVALASKNPWVGTPRQFANFEGDYASFPTKNYPMAMYNMDVDEHGIAAPPPHREPTPNPPLGMFEMIKDTKMAVEDGMGMSPRDVQAQNMPGMSRPAVLEDRKPSELGNYEFYDNLTRAIVHGIKVINAMIPEVIDTDRDIRYRAPDNTEMHVPVNTTVGKALERIRKDPERYRGKDVGLTVQRLQALEKKYGKDHPFNDLTQGKYDVTFSTGPSYATQRAEALDWWLKYAQIDKRVPAVMGDLIVGAHDDIFADAGSKRLRKMLPPGIAEKEAGEPEPTPMPPPPQVKLMMAKAQTEMAKQKTQEMIQQLKMLEARVELVKYYKETKEGEGEIRKQIIQILSQILGPQQGPAAVDQPPMGQPQMPQEPGEGM
jgi:hypothetical protein